MAVPSSAIGDFVIGESPIEAVYPRGAVLLNGSDDAWVKESGIGNFTIGQSAIEELNARGLVLLAGDSVSATSNLKGQALSIVMLGGTAP